MPKNEFEDEKVESIEQYLYEQIDDTNYTQEASMLMWRYVASLATDRARAIEQEMNE